MAVLQLSVEEVGSRVVVAVDLLAVFPWVSSLPDEKLSDFQ